MTDASNNSTVFESRGPGSERVLFDLRDVACLVGVPGELNAMIAFIPLNGVPLRIGVSGAHDVDDLIIRWTNLRGGPPCRAPNIVGVP